MYTVRSMQRDRENSPSPTDDCIGTQSGIHQSTQGSSSGAFVAVSDCISSTEPFDRPSFRTDFSGTRRVRNITSESLRRTFSASSCTDRFHSTGFSRRQSSVRGQKFHEFLRPIFSMAMCLGCTSRRTPSNLRAMVG